MKTKKNFIYYLDVFNVIAFLFLSLILIFMLWSTDDPVYLVGSMVALLVSLKFGEYL